MNETDERLLSALIDGEAGDGDRSGLLGPVPVGGTGGVAPSLLQRHAVLRALRDATRTHARRHAAPRSLAVLPARMAQQRAESEVRRARGGWPRDWHWWLSSAMVSSAAAAVLVTVLVQGVSRDEADDARLVSAHLRSMMSSQTVDVASADNHTVKPWFSGRLNYAPPVEDFAAQGFALIGGRIEVFDGEPVAALVYRRKQHLVNLYVMPTRQAGRLGARSDARHNGFNLAARRDGEFTFIAVSDLNPAELNDLLKLALGARG